MDIFTCSRPCNISPSQCSKYLLRLELRWLNCFQVFPNYWLRSLLSYPIAMWMYCIFDKDRLLMLPPLVRTTADIISVSPLWIIPSLSTTKPMVSLHWVESRLRLRAGCFFWTCFLFLEVSGLPKSGSSSPASLDKLLSLSWLCSLRKDYSLSIFLWFSLCLLCCTRKPFLVCDCCYAFLLCPRRKLPLSTASHIVLKLLAVIV